MDSMDEWTVVKKKKSIKTKSNNNLKANFSRIAGQKIKEKGMKLAITAREALGNTEKTSDQVLEIIEKTKLLLDSSLYIAIVKERLERAEVTNALSQITKIIALGLGSFSQSSNAQTQLCLLLWIRQYIQTEDHRIIIHLYDPVMSAVDCEVCKSLDIEVFHENKKGRYCLNEEKVLYFMPHCPYRLYCNVLWEHWNRLENLIIWGNR
jgi:hypothetical protein